MLDIDSRVSYYIGNIKNQKWKIFFNEDLQESIFIDKNNVLQKYKESSDFIRTNLIDKYFTINTYKETEYNRKIHLDYVIEYEINGYIEPMIKLFNSDSYFKDKKIIFRPDDVFFHTDVPIITKTRPVGDSYNILINLDRDRHWDELKKVNEYDIPFTHKNNKIIWRGASNGFGWDKLTRISDEIYNNMIKIKPLRRILCEKYYNHLNKMIDIGLINNEWVGIKEYDLFIKDYISIIEQLKSKFIISIEGADVATNLKWILYSNSVPVMPRPTMCSWLMEDKLEPWVHYVPLEKDYDDLEEKYNWCLNNLDKCEEIAKNGKKYIEQFLDEDREKKITNMVLKEYVDNVEITYGNSNCEKFGGKNPTRVFI